MITRNKLFNILILYLIALAPSGIHGKIAFGVRTIDILMLVSFFCAVPYIIKVNIYSEKFVLLLVFAFLPVIIGLIRDNIYFMSELRYWLCLFIAFVVFLRYRGKRLMEIVQYKYIAILCLLTLFIYFLISVYPSLGNFYGLQFYRDKVTWENRLLGPSPILICYMVLSLRLSGKNNTWFTLFYLVFVILIYYFTRSRQLLAILFVPLLYKRETIILPGLAGALYFIGLSSTRIGEMLHPLSSTAFHYRIVSNAFFIKNFALKEDVSSLLFGLGVGSIVYVDMGTYLGWIKMNILDNSILTLWFKSGLIGIIVFFLLLLKFSKGLDLYKKFYLFLPIIIMALLSAHLITNIKFVLGFLLSCYFVKNRLIASKQ